MAPPLHGSARVTYDRHICYSRGSANLRTLARALESFHPRPRGFPADGPFLWDEATLRNGTIFTLQPDIGEIDLLAEVTGLGTFDDVQKHAIAVEAKRASGREKDLAALPEFEGLLEAGGA